MGAIKEIPTFLPNKGINLTVPEEFLKNSYSATGTRNLEFYNQYYQGRGGSVLLDTTVLPSGVQFAEQFWKFDGTWFWVVATKEDIGYYDFVNARLNYIKKQYTTGTIEIQAGTPTIVRGNGTTWSTNTKAGDYIKIGSGNVHSGATWYKIESVDSNTQLTLTSSAATTAAGTAYVIRKTFTAADDQLWYARQFVDGTYGEIIVMTNGVDNPIYWAGSSVVTDLPMATGVTAAKYVEVYKDRVVLLHTTEGGQVQPQRERWCEVADITTWNDGDFRDFMEDSYWITGSILFGDYHIVFRERDAFVGRYVGGDYIFDYERATNCSGVWAGKSIVATDEFIFYYSANNKFNKWNIINEQSISDEILPYTKNFTPALEQQIFGYDVEWKNQIRWLVPYGDTTYHNAAIVYDYVEETINIWEYEQEQALFCIGEYLNTTDVFADDPVVGEIYADEWDGYADDRVYLEDAPVLVYGGYDGKLRKADTGYTDDGVAYERIFEGIRDNYKIPHGNKRLWKQQFWFAHQPSGEVSISLLRDDNAVYDTEARTVSIDDSSKDIVKRNITWDRQGQNFKVKITATNHFAMLGFMSFVALKGRTYR